MKSSKTGAGANILALLIALLFVGLIFAQADKKFVLDELDFPIVAKATSEIWLPVYYRGEATPQHLGLYHPPLYIYALALYVKVFGFSENTVRSFGLSCTLLTALLTIAIGMRLRDIGRASIFIPLFFGLYLLNPYTIANTTLPDIDQTVLPLLLSVFIFFLFDDKTSKPFLACIFGLLLWAKLTTPLALIPFAIAYWFITSHSPREVISRGLMVFGGGVLLFFITYWIYCKVAGLPFQYTFEFLAHSFTKGGDSKGMKAFLTKVAQNFSYSVHLVSWMTGLFVLLFVACAARLARGRAPGLDKAKTLLLFGLSSFIALFYCGLISPFGGFFKYPFPAFQFACLGVALVISDLIDNAKASVRLNGWLIMASVFLAAGVQIILWKDRTDMGTTLSARNLALAAVLLGGVFGVALAREKLRSDLMLMALSVVTGLAIGLQLGISRSHAVAAFPTKYYYGQQGMEETISYLKEQLAPGEPVWSMKDVGFYTGNRYIESYKYFFDSDGPEKIVELSKSKIRFFVATKGIGEDRLDAFPKIDTALGECCVMIKSFGNYYIYKARR